MGKKFGVPFVSNTLHDFRLFRVEEQMDSVFLV